MTTTIHAPAKSYGLMRAAEAVTNWRALALTALAGICVFLFSALTAWLGSKNLVVAALLGMVTMLVGLIGWSAVGIMLMRRAQGRDVGFMDAILQAVFTVHRLLGVGILLLLGFLGVALAALLVLFLCKIPGLGAFLYSIAFPILTIFVGVTIAGMFYVGFPLAAPAVWEGNTVFETMARLMVIVRRRLLMVITNLVILSLFVMFLAGVVAFILFSGGSATFGLSSAVGINPAGGFSSLLPGLMGSGLGRYGMDVDTAYLGAFSFATGLLFTIGSVIPFLTFINGTCLVYLQAVDGLNFGEAEEQLRDRVEEAKRRAQEAKERAGSKLQEAKSAMQLTPQPVLASNRACVKCNAGLSPDDLFCGDCGTKNPA